MDNKNITVSGLSAGAFMAVQYHVAHSSSVSGAGVIAGGVYHCANGKLETALTDCMADPLLISLTRAYLYTSDMESSSLIDASSNLGHSKVWLYSGTADTVVKQGGMKKLASYYGHYMESSRIQSVFNISSEHCWPTVDYGNACSKLGSPFISRCDYDASSHMMEWIMDGGLAPPKQHNPASLVSFDISAFLPSGVSAAQAELMSEAYAYVPSACKSGSSSSPCHLHINFHGCEQSAKTLGTQYMDNIGLLDVAEANNIVVIFPQVSGSVSSGNPDDCFNWCTCTTYTHTRTRTYTNTHTHVD